MAREGKKCSMALGLAAGAAAFGLLGGSPPSFVAQPTADVDRSSLRQVLPSGPAAVAGAAGSASPHSAALPGLVGVSLTFGGVAAAVARRSHLRTQAALRAFENELGVQAPVGFWDPAGFAQDGDAYEFNRRRIVELKHGRVSMLACIGYIVPEYFKFPGYLSPSAGIKFADVPNGLAALTKVPAIGWTQYVVFCGFCDLWAMHQVPTDPPGKLRTRFFGGPVTNYEYGFLGLPGYLGGKPITDPELKKKKLNSELANGRLAMVAIMAMLFQNGTVGTTGPEMWLPSGAAPKVLEGTGGPFADSFWDPAGLAKGKSDEQLLHWRAVELKHGRVAMLAVLGWFHVAAGWHPIGDFAAGTRVSDNPLVNVTQLSMGGAWQIVFTILVLEWLTTYVCKPPAQKPWDIIGWSDVIAEEENPDWKWHQLQEINNGRLAMVAIIGLITQDALFGDYFAGIGQPCFGNPICILGDNVTGPYPAAPYLPPPMYPRA